MVWGSTGRKMSEVRSSLDKARRPFVMLETTVILTQPSPSVSDQQIVQDVSRFCRLLHLKYNAVKNIYRNDLILNIIRVESYCYLILVFYVIFKDEQTIATANIVYIITMVQNSSFLHKLRFNNRGEIKVGKCARSKRLTRVINYIFRLQA